MAFRKKRSLWYSLNTLLLLFVLSLVCMGSFVLVADELCHRNISQRQPLYPGATIIEEDHNFLRSRGMGITRITLETDDDPEAVAQWMREITLELLNADEYRGIATVGWHHEADGDGTRIYYYAECAQ